MQKTKAPGAGDAEGPKGKASEWEGLPLTEIASRSKGNARVQRAQKVAATLELLAERWPACFHLFEKRRWPLKVGIHIDIMAALDGAVTPSELRRALGCYTANYVYRSRLVVGAMRVGLDGLPCGTVTEKEAEYARAIERRRRNKLAKQIASKPVAPAPLPKPAPPQRLSLADLREAAQRRKAVTP